MLSTILAKKIIYEVGKLFEKDLIIVNTDGERLLLALKKELEIIMKGHYFVYKIWKRLS